MEPSEYVCTPEKCKMLGAHVPECFERAGEGRRALEESLRDRRAELALAKAAGIERAIEILRASNDACGEFYHDGCGCQERLIWSMGLEARALRGEEI